MVRATAITRILTDAGIDPSRITAAGKGEFVPLTENETADGRKQNRICITCIRRKERTI